MPKALTKEQVEQYRRDGFVSPMRVMSEDEAAEFRRRMEEAEAAGQLSGIGQTKFYLRFPWVHEMATRASILDAVEDLIGPDLMLYHNTLWFKNGGDGAYVSWHQDNTYFGHEPCDVLTVWLALTPADEENGCMQFLPGTHRLGQLALRAPDIGGANMLSSGQTVDFDATTVKPVPVILRPGEASIHHAFLIHGSGPSRSAERRMGVTLIYHPPGLGQLGDCRTTALLVRGEDRFGHFDPERAPVAGDEAGNDARHEQAVARYRAKVRELGNLTVTRLD